MSLLWRNQKLKLILFSFCISSCYSLRVIQSHHKLYSKRKKIVKVLKSNKVDKKTKEKLHLVHKLLVYAKSQKLRVGKAYQELIFNGEDAVSYLIQVARPYKLEWVQWTYPILGEVPYQGFFDESRRNKEFITWKDRGYDVHKSKVTAFSSLGWFADPVYLSMLKLEDSDLAETIFHELIHRTYWIKNDVFYNEQLATFLSQKMVLDYLKLKRKKKKLASYKKYLKDKKTFYFWLVDLKKNLSEYYSSLNDSMSDEEKREGKKAIFTKHLTEKKPSFTKYNLIGDTTNWNNARVLARSLYNPNFEAYSRAYACYSNKKVGDFLQDLTQLKHESFEKKIKSLCSSSYEALK